MFLSTGFSVPLDSSLPFLIKPPIPAASPLLILTLFLTRGLFARSARSGFVRPPDTVPVPLELTLLPGLTLEITLPGCLPLIGLPVLGLAIEALVLLETVVLSRRTRDGLDGDLTVPEETLGFESVILLRGPLTTGVLLLTVALLLLNLVVLFLRKLPAELLLGTLVLAAGLDLVTDGLGLDIL